MVLVILMHCFLERNHYIQKSIGTLPPIEEERQQLKKNSPWKGRWFSKSKGHMRGGLRAGNRGPLWIRMLFCLHCPTQKRVHNSGAAIVSYNNALWAAREPAFLAGDITCSTEELRWWGYMPWPVAQNCLVGLYLHTARKKGRDLNYFWPARIIANKV